MDNFEKENKELNAVEDQLRQKFKKKGLNKQQIEFKMMQLDVDFLVHVYVNGNSLEKSSVKKRLMFYIEALKNYRDEE